MECESPEKSLNFILERALITHLCIPCCYIQKPDIGVEVTDGCQGFATKYLDWPEELIVGGMTKNRTDFVRRLGFL